MLRYILLKVIRVILSIITGLAIDYGFAEVTAERLQQMPRPLVWVILILLAGGSGYGMYKLLGLFNGRVRDNRW
jgi:hypothetical protein